MNNSLSLCQYLAESGGLRMVRNGRATDGSGDLRAMGAPWWHMGRSFRRKLCRDDAGLCPDAAALAAWEAGYFPSHTERPDLSDFLEAVRRDIATGGFMAGHDGDGFTLAPVAAVAVPGHVLPGKPAGATVVERDGIVAYLYEVRGLVINGRYVGQELAALMGKPITSPYRADAYKAGRRLPVWSVACGTAGERDERAAAYLAEVPF